MVEATSTTSFTRGIEFIVKNESISEGVGDKFKASFLVLIQDVKNEAKLYDYFVKNSGEASLAERL